MPKTKIEYTGLNFTKHISTLETLIKEVKGITLMEISENYFVIKYKRYMPKWIINQNIDSIFAKIRDIHDN